MSEKHKKNQMSIISIQKKYNTEEDCRELLFNLRFPHGFVCPACGYSEYNKIGTRNLYQCKSCRHQTSVTSGTVMHRTHIKLKLWVWAMFLFVNDKRGCSAEYLMKALSVTYKTAWYMLHRLRKSMSNREQQYLLNGIVELDDTYFGSPDHGKKRGRGTSKIKVMVAVSKTDKGAPKYIKLKVMPNLKSISVGKFAAENIAEGSHIESDNYMSYRKPLADKYFHKYETYSADKKMLEWVHTIISNAKSFVIGTYHRMEAKYFQLYLDEFAFRFNRRSYNQGLFQRLAFAVMNCPPCSLGLAVLKG